MSLSYPTHLEAKAALRTLTDADADAPTDAVCMLANYISDREERERKRSRPTRTEELSQPVSAQ